MKEKKTMEKRNVFYSGEMLTKNRMKTISVATFSATGCESARTSSSNVYRLEIAKGERIGIVGRSKEVRKRKQNGTERVRKKEKLD
jgi:outer membrane lipoprotein SlyB